jgi:hypothetical protein
LEKILFLQRPAPAAPAIAAAAKIPATAAVCETIRQANILAAIEVPVCFFDVEAAALDYAGSNAAFLEGESEGNARCAAANYADIGLDFVSILQVACVNEHLLPPPLYNPVSVLGMPMRQPRGKNGCNDVRPRFGDYVTSDGGREAAKIVPQPTRILPIQMLILANSERSKAFALRSDSWDKRSDL